MKYIVVIAILFVNMLKAQDVGENSDIFDKKFINEDGIYFELKQSNDVFGFAGCNNFAGKVNIDVNNKSITFAPLATTRKFCMDGENNIEQDFLKNIQFITNFEYQKNEKILLLKDNNSKVIFKLTHK